MCVILSLARYLQESLLGCTSMTINEIFLQSIKVYLYALLQLAP